MGEINNNKFDFYYGKEAEQFSFYRIPKLLFTDSRFSKVSIEAKVLYGLMLDRMSLSIKNGWVDEENRVYIYFKVSDAMEYMKEINDSYGHFSGDDAIKTVAKALKDTLGEKADIYRIGGDEFVCISESNVLPYISQFKDTISFIDREKLYKLSVSIGYSKYHEKYTKSIDDIICRADEKMYKAKKAK